MQGKQGRQGKLELTQNSNFYPSSLIPHPSSLKPYTQFSLLLQVEREEPPMSPELAIEADLSPDISPDISEMVIDGDEPELAIEADLLPDISELAIEDDIPVDNLISEKQQRLLTEPLYSNLSALGARTFLLAANVGVFYAVRQPPLVPDVFLSLDVEVPQDWREKKNRTYFVWEFGKPPDVVIEIVSHKEGNELGSKLNDYARMGVAYYIVFDPLEQLGDRLVRSFEQRAGRYQEMTASWLDAIGIGLTLWDGKFEGKDDRWLRWCNAEGIVIPTGAENAEQERQRAERAEAKAADLAERLRAMGIDPDA